MNRIIPVIAIVTLLGAAAFAQSDTPPPAVPAPASIPAQIDPAAMAILEKSQAKMLGLKTFRAECWETTTFLPDSSGTIGKSRYEMATLTAVKPNRMRYDKWEMSAPSATAPDAPASTATWKRKKPTPTYQFVSDGTTSYRQFGDTYRADKNTGPEYMSTLLEPWSGFYSKHNSPFALLQYYQTKGELTELQLDGTKTVDGVTCNVIHYRVKTEYNKDAVNYDSRLFVGRDGIVRRKTETVQIGDKPAHVNDAVIRNVVLDAKPRNLRLLFVYAPPKGVKRLPTLAPAPKPPKGGDEPVLLAAGTPAPDFSATDVEGTAVKLSDLRGKVVVVDFWASWCPPCVASMPHNQKVIKKLQDEGLSVVLLAVDNSEERPAFAAWVKKHPEYGALRFVHADRAKLSIAGDLYHVSGIPTQYIVDASGVVRSSSVGFGGETDEMEKAIRAALVAK